MKNLAEQKKLILIIEDDRDIRESMEEFLGDSGFEMYCAENGSKGLEILRSIERTPDLILLDLMMPIMDGFQFREAQVKESRWSAIPVIVMSADGRANEKKMAAKPVAYLRKPVDISVLIDAIETHVA